MRHLPSFALCLSMLPLAACTADPDAPGAAWEGATEHVTLVGAVGGRELEVALTGAQAQDLEVVFCERNYVSGALEKIEIKHAFEFDGMPAELKIEFDAFDFTGEPSDTIAIRPAGDHALTTSDMSVQMAIELEDGTEIEDFGVTGTFELELFTGTAGEDGMIPSGEGSFGGYLDATLDGGGEVQLSFTARCGENDVE